MTTKINKAHMLFTGRPRSRLINNTWKEISGVDHPANEEEGWLVLKAKQLGSTGDDDEWAEELAEELYETDFSSCPAEINTAARTLKTWLAQAGYDGQSEERSELPGQFLSTAMGMTDFSAAPANVKQSAAMLGSYLAADYSEDGENEEENADMSNADIPNVFPPVGIQLYGGNQRSESRGTYSLRPGNGSQGFTGALSSGRSTARRARGTNLTKASYAGNGQKSKGKKNMNTPTFKQLAQAIEKAAGDRFYGPDFGSSPFTTGNSNSYFSSQSPNQSRGGAPSADPGGAGGDSFYTNWNNVGPYIPTGNDGVSDGELASGLNNVAEISRRAGKEAADAAFDQFLEAGWSDFSKKAASIIANYSSGVTSPTWGGSSGGGPGDVHPEMNIPANIAKSAQDELSAAVEEYKENVLKNMTAWVELTKRDFR